MKTMTIITLSRLCNIGYISLFIGVSAILLGCKNDPKTNDSEGFESEIVVHPISHSTMILEYENIVVYVDPVGELETYDEFKPANVIVITDVHGDHLNNTTLKGLVNSSIKIIGPVAVLERLPDELRKRASVVTNFQSIDLKFKGSSINIEGIPAYNLREEAKDFHKKGRGNGYILTMGDERVYISGDTEDTPEMRALENIDVAFICMNLPWTMSVESAASAVLEFKPKIVYPYHYRSTNGLSDIEKFKSIVNKTNSKIDVRLLNWYPNR